MKLLSFIIPFGRSRLVRSGNPPRIVVRASEYAAVGLLCLLSAFRAWSADCVSPPAGLVAWWPGQGNANDIAGTNNGVLEGGVAFAAGKVGQAFSFDGTNSYVQVPSSPELNPTGSFSIEAWIYPQQDVVGIVAAKWGDTGELNNERSYCLNTVSGRALNFCISDFAHQWDPSFHLFATDPGAIALNAWNHVAAVYDQSTGTRLIFVNGVQAKSRTDAPITIYNGVAPFTFGASVRGGGIVIDYLHGLLDEVSIYSRALSAAEIAAIYSASSAGKCVPPPNCIPPPSGLVAWWQGEGNALDSTGTNNGTLSGNTTFAPARVGQGFVFDGNGAAVQLGNPANLRLQDLTIETWIRRASTSVASLNGNGNGHIFGYNSGGYGIYMDPSGTPTLTKTDINEVKPSMMITDTNWHHVAVTKSGSTVVFYVDGVVYPAAAYNPGFTFSGNAFIGGLGNNFTFYGTVDEVSVYNRALAANEIQAIYNADSAGKCAVPVITSQPGGQVGYWGKSVVFNVYADGTPPLHYQWLKNGTPVEGATGSSLVLTNLQLTDAGNYSVVVTNAYDSTTSSNAYLTVNPAGVSLALYSGITIDGVVGLTYGIQYSTDLSNTNGWRGMANVTLGVPTELWFDVQPANQPQRYYRVVPGPISVP